MNGRVVRCCDMVACGTAMRQLFALVERFALSDAPALVLGETGTGKELVARALHELGPRRGEPFVALNCGALATGLLEAELFGHERGAFTGAHARRPGAFEQADGGTLLLDEIGELPLEAQSRLLRVLETRRVRRVGGTVEKALDVRVVSATHRDLTADVVAGRFRADLYHRLAVLSVMVPALRDRREDIPAIAFELIASAVGEGDVPPALGPDALERLAQHDWPGNVRELRNVLLRALAFREPGERALRAELLTPQRPPRLRRPLRAAAATSLADSDDARVWGVPLQSPTIAECERVLVADTLRRHGGNRTAAAEALGISRSTLREKIRRYSGV